MGSVTCRRTYFRSTWQLFWTTEHWESRKLRLALATQWSLRRHLTGGRGVCMPVEIDLCRFFLWPFFCCFSVQQKPLDLKRHVTFFVFLTCWGKYLTRQKHSLFRLPSMGHVSIIVSWCMGGPQCRGPNVLYYFVVNLTVSSSRRLDRTRVVVDRVGKYTKPKDKTSNNEARLDVKEREL